MSEANTSNLFTNTQKYYSFITKSFIYFWLIFIIFSLSLETIMCYIFTEQYLDLRIWFACRSFGFSIQINWVQFWFFPFEVGELGQISTAATAKLLQWKNDNIKKIYQKKNIDKNLSKNIKYLCNTFTL